MYTKEGNIYFPVPRGRQKVLYLEQLIFHWPSPLDDPLMYPLPLCLERRHGLSKVIRSTVFKVLAEYTCLVLASICEAPVTVIFRCYVWGLDVRASICQWTDNPNNFSSGNRLHSPSLGIFIENSGWEGRQEVIVLSCFGEESVSGRMLAWSNREEVCLPLRFSVSPLSDT